MDNHIEHSTSPSDDAWFNLIDKYIATIDLKTETDTENMDYTKLKSMLMEYKMLLLEKRR